MVQTPTRTTFARTAYQPASAGDDLDALLDSIMGEDPEARQERASGSAREAMRRRLEQQRSERLNYDEAATDELRSQLRALARQVQALSEANNQHTANTRAINELRQTMREVLAATHPPPKAATAHLNAEVQLPSIKVKLVLAQAAHLMHQSDRDVTLLSGWAMLFGGIGVGMALSISLDLAGLQTVQIWIYVVLAFFAVVVASVFALLAWQARRRTAQARKEMEDTAITRTVPMN